MSNLLNLKGVKFFAIIVLAVAILATFGMVATTASAQQAIVTVSDIQYAATVRLGSSGQAALIWQRFINGYSTTAQLVEDGKFGPLTDAQARAWQASRGLVADGVLGPLSRASAMAQISAGAPASAFPAGCTAWTGYSTSTGMLCSGGSNLPAGCMSTSGFSPSTGARCDGGGSTPSPSGPLVGGAGDITLDDKSTYSGEEVIAGEEDVPVMAFEVEADDESDVAITSVKVEFFQQVGASSDRLEDYIDSVSIWFNGDKVGEADADEFSESSNYYSKSISLDGAVVRAGETEDFTVAVTALNNLDSGDIDADIWNVDLLSVRFEDADGVVTTESADAAATDDTGAHEKEFDFDDLSTSGDLQLTLATASASPNASSVEADTVTTTDVDMLEFTLKAEGSDMLVDSLELAVVAVNVDATFADMVSSFTLEADGEEIDSVSAFVGADGATGDLLFNNLDLTIDENDTVTFTVVAKIRAIGAGVPAAGVFDAGDTLTVNFANANLVDTTNTDVEDSNGDVVAAGDRSGSAVGEAQTFYSSGVMVDMGSVTYESVTDAGNITQVTYNIPLTVTAFGDTRYVGLAADEEEVHTLITDDLSVSYAAQLSSAPTSDIVQANSTTTDTWSCDATIEGGTAYRLDEDDVVNCTLQVVLTAATGTPGSFRIHVEGFQTYTDAALSTGELIQALTPAEDFETGFKFLTS